MNEQLTSKQVNWYVHQLTRIRLILSLCFSVRDTGETILQTLCIVLVHELRVFFS